jgi:hypothetical protein
MGWGIVITVVLIASLWGILALTRRHAEENAIRHLNKRRKRFFQITRRVQHGTTPVPFPPRKSRRSSREKYRDRH